MLAVLLNPPESRSAPVLGGMSFGRAWWSPGGFCGQTFGLRAYSEFAVNTILRM